MVRAEPQRMEDGSVVDGDREEGMDGGREGGLLALMTRECGQDVRLLWSPGVCTVTYVPFGTGMVRFSPAAFVVVNEVSSALCLGMVITGGNSRRVSLKTLSTSKPSQECAHPE